MKERPILFSGPMVRAILEGRKMQTRRVLNPQPILERGKDGENWWLLDRSNSGYGPTNSAWKENDQPFWTYCPYGQEGDLLWVRESFIHIEATYCYEASTSIPVVPSHTIYRADEVNPGFGPWTPSIHMPRSLSRILLEITKVRVERLQEISEEDARAEGVDAVLFAHCSMCHATFLNSQVKMLPSGADICPRCKVHNFTCAWNGEYECREDEEPTAVERYELLWDSINSKRDGGKYAWNKNPFVWVLEFKQVSA